MDARDTGSSDPWADWPEDWDVESRFDGGAERCGDMLVDLRDHLRSEAPKCRVAVRSSGAGAPIEIPAWCRITRHRLLASKHPYYWIEVRTQ